MSHRNHWIRRHPLAGYFLLAFALSWGGVLAVVAPAGIPGTPEQFERLIGPAVIAMLLGPSIAGLALTGILDGRAGYREFAARLGRWKVGIRWYAVALLSAPVLLTVVHLLPGMNEPRFMPAILASEDRAGVLRLAILAGLGAGLFEETGWTGFALPRLRRRHGFLAGALLLGLVWAAWHLLTTWWGSDASGGSIPAVIFVPLEVVAFLPPFRLAMAWVFERTGSLMLAMLMHASLTCSVLLSMPPGTGRGEVLIHDFAFGALVWIVIGIAAAARRVRFGHPSPSPAAR